MKFWSETLQLSQPLRDVSIRSGGNDLIAPSQPSSEQLRASYERGRLDGEKSLSEQLLKQRAEVHDLLHGALQGLSRAVPQVVRETEAMITSLALNVARKIVADLPISRSVVEAAVRDALSQVEGTAQFTIRLNPADLELLKKAGSTLLTSDGTNEFNFVASPEISRGGCLVQTRFGTVDARRETKMDLLTRSLQP